MCKYVFISTQTGYITNTVKNDITRLRTLQKVTREFFFILETGVKSLIQFIFSLKKKPKSGYYIIVTKVM